MPRAVARSDKTRVTFLVGVRPDAWLSRFGDDVPAVALALQDAVRVVGADVRESAEALGVLRAHQGHAVAGLVEDLQALRAEAVDEVAVDTALRLAVSAYVDELTAVLGSRATRDPLTGLPNRAAFDEALAHEVAATARTAAPSLLLVDLDKFKRVNDTDGHLAGDAVLVAVADVLRRNVRPSDVACRLGGDEFAVVLPRTSATRAEQVARRLLAAARKEAGLSSPQARVTFSVGVGWLASPSDGAALVAVTDAALYAVKDSGGDDVRVGRP